MSTFTQFKGSEWPPGLFQDFVDEYSCKTENGYDSSLAVREIPVRNLWIANFRIFIYEIYVQNQWGHKTLRLNWTTAKLAVKVRLLLVRIE